MARSVSLRTTLGVVLAALVLLCGVGSAALIFLADRLERTSSDVGGDVERQTLVHDAERELLLLDRAHSFAVRDGLGRDLTSDVTSILAKARDDTERASAEHALARVRAHVTARVAAPADANATEDLGTEAALAELESIERTRLEHDRERGEMLDSAAKMIGTTTGIIVLIGSIFLVVLVHRVVVRPLLGLASRLRTFGPGEAFTRLDEGGPSEVQQIAAAFNAMADRLDAQERAHRTYLAATAHDLKNPIQALRLAVELEPAIAHGAPAEARVLGIMKRQLGQLDRLVSDLLDTASLRAGHLELDLSTHDLRDVASAVSALFERTSSRHSLVVALPERSVPVRCDAHRIEQVLTNLVNNAVKYSPEGGTVRVALAADEDAASLSVTDEGVGMTPEQVASVFSAFTRGATLRDSVPGHGLGLFVANQIVTEHGGTLRVESAPGRGSRFDIVLPLRGPG